MQEALSKTQMVSVIAGYTVTFSDGVRIEILHPQKSIQITDGLDDNAMVFQIIYGEVSFLFTSDVSPTGQQQLLAAGQWPTASVLQLPQHGTLRSLNKDFLAAVQPQAVMLQSDPSNRRGDPDPDTIALLDDIPLFRTDQGGTIHLWTDGKELWAMQENKFP